MYLNCTETSINATASPCGEQEGVPVSASKLDVSFHVPIHVAYHAGLRWVNTKIYYETAHEIRVHAIEKLIVIHGSYSDVLVF